MNFNDHYDTVDSHYNMNNYSRETWQLANNKLILKQEKEAKDDLVNLAHLSDEEIDYILS